MVFYQIRSETVGEVMISLVFAFKVTIFIRLGHKLCKVMISLVFAFKVMVFIRLGHKVSVK